MMWVIRAGQNSLYYDKYIHNSKVYIPWSGYKMDLSGLKTRVDFRTVVEKKRGQIIAPLFPTGQGNYNHSRRKLKKVTLS